MMQEYLQPIIKSLESLALQTPLELFVSLCMFIDEIFPPIPSLFMLIIAGAVAKAQNQPLLFILYLSILGGVGKTLGAWILYVIGDKGEHIIVHKFGKTLGVTQKEIDQISRRLNKGWKDFIVIFLARAIPIIPTTPISLVCGILKIDKKTYLIASFIGTIIRSIFFLYFGYIGLMSYEKSGGELNNLEAIAQIVLITLLIGVWIWYKMKKNSRRDKGDKKD